MAAVPAARAGEKIVQIYAEQLIINPANHRFELGDINGLANSILSHGIKQALRVKKTKLKTEDGYPKYLVLVGNRRAAAAKKIADKMEEGDFVPVIILPEDYSTDQAVMDSVVTDMHNKSRNMLEIAYDLKVLVEGGAKQKDLAKPIGASAQYVSDALFLVNTATDGIIAQIKAGTLSCYDAVNMMKSTPAEEVEEVIVKTVAKKQKAAEEEAVRNPDKKANTKTKLKKSELEETSGKPLTEKSKKAASSSAAETSKLQAGGVQEKKEDPSLVKLQQLKKTLAANAGTQRTDAFNALGCCIKYLKGTMTPLEMLEYFFEEAEEEAPAPAKKSKAKAEPVPAAKKSAKGKKAAAEEEEPETDELDDLLEDNDEEIE